MRAIIIFAGFCLINQVHAQRIVDVTDGDTRLSPASFYSVGGVPFVNDKYVKLVEGSPYFSNEWQTGMLVSATGQEYKGLTLKLNLYTNEVLYKDDKDIEMVATTSVNEVVLTDAAGNNYRFIHSSALPQQEANPLKSGWYQWLCSGTASLYKYYNKLLSESTPYGSATTEQKIKTKEKYLVNYNSAFIEIGKIKNAPDVLANKKMELEIFLKEIDDRNTTMEDRFVALIQYYNSFFVEK